MPRMAGRYCKSFCPICRGPAGEDCPDSSAPSVKAVRRKEKVFWRKDQDREDGRDER